MITIKEIARAAGVTTTTVSNVIHGKVNKVSPQTQEKIQALLKENNYVPRLGLNVLTNRGSRIIGVLVNTPDFVEHTPYERPFYATVIGTLENEFRRQGYYLMILSSKDVPEILRMVLGWNVDGVITISMPQKYYQKIGELTGKPVVSIDMQLEQGETVGECYNVTSKDYHVGKMMMQYLLSKGLRKMIFILNVTEGADYQRYSGAQEVWRKVTGSQESLNMVRLGRTYAEREQVYENLSKLTVENAALLFSADLNAVEAIGYFTRRQICIPEDISVVGFDGDIYARLSVPGLTTMALDSAKKAEYATKMLLDLIEGTAVPQSCIEIDGMIVERESVRR